MKLPAAALALAMSAVMLACAGQAMAQARSADGENRRIRVHNQTGVELRSLSAADAGGVFGPDLLGSPLPTGQSRPVLVDSGGGACVFTIRAVLTNGQTLDRPGVNVCRIADWYLTR